MHAQLLTQPGRPLAAVELPPPRPGPGQVLIAVNACAVCRTDLHILDGELPHPKLPLVLGHERVGSYGFGAAAHIVAQVARHQGRQVFAFTRPGDAAAQHFARSLGAVWAGGSDETPPEPLDAALIFAPVGALVPAALAATRKGGTVVCGGIHMSDIPSFPYRLLWEERVVRSVANLTRRDAEEFMALAPKVPLDVRVTAHPLGRANEVLTALRSGRVVGAAALVP